VRVCDSASTALRTALERTRAGECVKICDEKTVEPRGEESQPGRTCKNCGGPIAYGKTAAGTNWYHTKESDKGLCGNAQAQDAHEGFAKLKGELGHEKGVTDPAALAASIGRKKYGAAGMAAKSAAGRAKDSEEFGKGDKVRTDVTPKIGTILGVEGSGDMAKVLVRFGEPDKYGIPDVRKLYAHLLRKSATDCSEVMPVGDARAKDFGPDSVPVKEALKLVKRSLPNATAKEIAEFYNALGEDKTPRYIAEWYVHDKRLDQASDVQPVGDFTSKGRECDACGCTLKDSDYAGSGSWSYKCPMCKFKYNHGGKTAQEQMEAQGK